MHGAFDIGPGRSSDWERESNAFSLIQTVTQIKQSCVITYAMYVTVEICQVN